MKKAIWILFVVFTLIWTGFAFLAAGLARWTSDAMASDFLAQAPEYVALAQQGVTQKFTDATGRVAEQVTSKAAQLAGSEAEAEPQAPTDGSTAAATMDPAAPATAAPILPPLPPLPPLPEWVNQWLEPELIQSIKEWGAWAKSAANVGKTTVTNAADESARVVSETLHRDAAAQASGAVEAADTPPAEAHGPGAVAESPWLAKIVGWLVPIVWAIWGIGLAIGLLVTWCVQWGLNRLMGSSLLKPASSH